MPHSDKEARLLVQSITDYAVYRLDADGFVASWNAGAERMKGYRAEEIVGRHFSLFFTAEDRAKGEPGLSLRTARDVGRYEQEGWLVRKDGTPFRASTVINPIRDEDGDLIGFAEVTADIGAKHAARETLRVNEQRLRLLMDNVVRCAIHTVDMGGFVTSWNSDAQRLKGYARDEILGQHFSIFFTPEDQAEGKPARALQQAQQAGRFEEEAWRVRNDGTRIRARAVLDLMVDENGQLIGFAQTIQDISERRSLENAREQLYRVQKMETVGQLTGGLAHDFNNLLSTVMGSLELISRQPGDRDALERLVETAQRAAARGAKLTAQLLSFSRRQLLNPQTSNVNDLIAAIDALLRRAGGDAIEIQIDLDPSLWLNELDQSHFQSALLNLVVNARDAMPTGGVLSIKTRNLTIGAEAAAELTEISAGSYVVVTVRDTGVGMAPEVRARAIEPFYTTKDVGQGSGLGLSQAYGFVRQSDGQMKIESEIGKGTSVILLLPKSMTSQIEEPPPGRRSIELIGGTILVVEDDPDVLDIATQAIQSFGYEVHSAPDGHAALTVLRRNVPVDLLFTDVVMPHGMNGVELAREACRLRPTLRVLLASGYPRKALQEREGVDDSMAFIAKPYSLSVLSEQLRTLTLGAPN